MDTMTMPVDDLLSQAIAPAITSAAPELQECELDEVTTATATQIRVDFTDEAPIVIDEIVDRHGRLSDILEALETELGVSVIPLRLAKIANEVTKLQRHEIFSFAGENYAFSQTVRRDVVDAILASIVSNISSGIPFSYDLVTSVMYNGESYRTLALSRNEWTYILSKCRNFKQSLVTDMSSRITLNVYAERA